MFGFRGHLFRATGSIIGVEGSGLRALPHRRNATDTRTSLLAASLGRAAIIACRSAGDEMHSIQDVQ